MKIMLVGLGMLLLAACTPVAIPFHYAVVDDADAFYKGLWEKTGLCIIYPDGSIGNPDAC